MLHEGTGPGSEYLGWRDLPDHYDRGEFQRVLPFPLLFHMLRRLTANVQLTHNSLSEFGECDTAKLNFCCIKQKTRIFLTLVDRFFEV